MKRLIILIVFVATLLIAAKPQKLTFNDVTYPDSTVGEIEATVKTNYTTCRYFSDDYLAYLGRYDEAVMAGDVLQFCLDNYFNRQ